MVDQGMSARRFTRSWITTVLVTAALILAFPFLLYLAVNATDCRGVGGACGAMAAVFGIYLRLPIVA